MRGRKKLLGFAVFLSVLLIVPLVFSFGVVDVSQFLFGSSPASSIAESSSTPLVFVDPAAISDETLQSGSYFEFLVNISEVTDLFSWQINASWNPSILNFTKVTYGTFLRSTASPNGTSSWINRGAEPGVPITGGSNVSGYVWVAETILDGRPDATGVSGSGRLVSIEFLVTGYGSTDLTISLSGNLLTTLLNSTGETITFTKADGYFSNMIPGDLDCDGYVGPVDLSMFAAAYGRHEGDALYNPDADLDPPGNPDGYIGPIDLSYFAAQYGKHV